MSKGNADWVEALRRALQQAVMDHAPNPATVEEMQQAMETCTTTAAIISCNITHTTPSNEVLLKMSEAGFYGITKAGQQLVESGELT